jgi:hypothetical protein
MPYEIYDSPEEMRSESPYKPQVSKGLKYGVRTGLRTAARAGEAALGLPGDIASTGLSLLNKAVNVPHLETIQGVLPTSSNIKENVTKRLTGEYLEPQTKGEELYDDIVSDIASLMLPIGGKIPFKRAIGTALGGNLAGFLTKKITGSEIAGEGVKIGTMLLGSSAGGRRALTKQMKKSYPVSEALAKGEKLNIEGVPRKLKEFKRELRLAPEDVQKHLAPEVASIEKEISRGQVSLGTGVKLKKKINSAYENAPKGSDHYLNELNGIMKSSIKKGSKIYPEFMKEFTKADDIATGLKRASEATQFLNKYINKSTIGSPLVLGLLFHVFKPLSNTAIGVGSGLLGSAIAGRELFRTLDFLKNSKEAQKYYAKIMKNALIGNAATLAKDVAKLDYLANKYEKDNAQGYEVYD